MSTRRTGTLLRPYLCKNFGEGRLAIDHNFTLVVEGATFAPARIELLHKKSTRKGRGQTQ